MRAGRRTVHEPAVHRTRRIQGSGMQQAERQVPAAARRTTMVLLWLAAAAIVAYWVSFFSGGEVQATAENCYLVFQRNFPLPDGFVALCAVLAAEGLRRRRAAAVLWGLLTAGGLFFLAWIDIAYNLWNDMYALRTPEMVAEAAINVFCLAMAVWLVAFCWRRRRELGA
ncbi:MAG: hypothetical protein ACREVL_03495 [Solimonas sp.]